jgi:4-hydroxy-3-methylbut-2-en-1-yl diphosphate reductase
MLIQTAKNSGLCFGVKRALKMARKTVESKSGPVYSLGELIHNPQVISELKNQGITPEKNPQNIHDSTVIIRSHGVAPEIYRILERNRNHIIDATCPNVKKIQNRVHSLSEKENEIIIFGSPSHPETSGLKGYGGDAAVVVETEQQAARLPNRKKRAVLAQSTQDIRMFKRIISALMDKTRELKVYNTICPSTLIRQKSTSELASQVDVLFVIGGKNSSNTHKLYSLAKTILPQTFFVENSGQIVPEMIKDAGKIGLTGGASTPPGAIEEAEKKIKSIFKYHIDREKMSNVRAN